MAGLGTVKFTKNESTIPSPGDLSDMERLDDFPEADFRGVTLSLSQETTEATSPNPGEQRTIETSHLVHNNRGSGDFDRPENNCNDRSATAAATSSVRQFSRDILEEETKEYFAVRDGAIENAVDQCSPVLMKHVDGELLGVWLLTEIDHWDTEKERLVFLTEFSVIVLKYDFITLRLLEYRRLQIKSFDRVQIGPLTYPHKSFMPNRNQEGVRCSWDRGAILPLRKEWNPWCREIPWVTFTSHHLCTTPVSGPHHDVRGFSTALVRALERLDLSAAPPSQLTRSTPCEVVHEPLVVCSYLGVAAAFHNANHLGFFKARGKVSF